MFRSRPCGQVATGSSYWRIEKVLTQEAEDREKEGGRQQKGDSRRSGLVRLAPRISSEQAANLNLNTKLGRIDTGKPWRTMRRDMSSACPRDGQGYSRKSPSKRATASRSGPAGCRVRCIAAL